MTAFSHYSTRSLPNKAVKDGDEELVDQFNDHGLPDSGDLAAEVALISEVVTTGKFIAGRTS